MEFVLPALILVPLIGAIITLFMGGSRQKYACTVALVFTVATLLLSLILMITNVNDLSKFDARGRCTFAVGKPKTERCLACHAATGPSRGSSSARIGSGFGVFAAGAATTNVRTSLSRPWNTVTVLVPGFTGTIVRNAPVR